MTDLIIWFSLCAWLFCYVYLACELYLPALSVNVAAWFWTLTWLQTNQTDCELVGWF